MKITTIVNNIEEAKGLVNAMFEDEEIKAKGVHGTNERISVRAYLQGIRVLIRMMDETC